MFKAYQARQMDSTITVNTDKWRLAVEEGKLAVAASLARYKRLSTKITQYPMGDEPAPTENEFNPWLADVQRAVALKHLLNGVSGA